MTSGAILPPLSFMTNTANDDRGGSNRGDDRGETAAVATALEMAEEEAEEIESI